MLLYLPFSTLACPRLVPHTIPNNATSPHPPHEILPNSFPPTFTKNPHALFCPPRRPRLVQPTERHCRLAALHHLRQATRRIEARSKGSRCHEGLARPREREGCRGFYPQEDWRGRRRRVRVGRVERVVCRG